MIKCEQCGIDIDTAIYAHIRVWVGVDGKIIRFCQQSCLDKYLEQNGYIDEPIDTGYDLIENRWQILDL